MARLTLGEQLTALQQAHKELQESYQALRHNLDSQIAHAAAVQANFDALYPLQGKVSEQAGKIEELERKLKDKSSSYEHKTAELTKAEAELEQAHAVLDGVEGAPTRDYEKTLSYGGTSTCQRNVVTRLAGAFLAIAQKNSTATS